MVSLAGLLDRKGYSVTTKCINVIPVAHLCITLHVKLRRNLQFPCIDGQDLWTYLDLVDHSLTFILKVVLNCQAIGDVL